MTNNLKILTILSIFILILTGYFCFSSSFTKNQIIANNNEEKDDKDPDINNEDSKDNEEKASKLSILDVIVLIAILIVIVGVIIFIIIDFNKSKSKSETEIKFQEKEKEKSEIKIEKKPEIKEEKHKIEKEKSEEEEEEEEEEEIEEEEEFKIKENSEKDFKKENFCPTFFLIRPSKAIDIYNIEENGNYFFKVLAKRILPENEMHHITHLKIYLEDNKMDLNDKEYTISLGAILDEIAKFAAFTKNVKEEDADEITESSKIGVEEMWASDFVQSAKEYVAELEKKYDEDFDNYLCSYILHYLMKETPSLSKVIKKDNKDTEEGTYQTKFVLRDKFNESKSKVIIQKSYHVNYTMILKILPIIF